MSKTYTVTWSIDLEADNPVDAAFQARGVQLDLETTATAFRVDSDTESLFIDLHPDIDGPPILLDDKSYTIGPPPSDRQFRQWVDEALWD